MPNMCSPTDCKSSNIFHFYIGTLLLEIILTILSAFNDWLVKKDPEFRDFLHWKTDENDFRNYVPEYLKKFAKPLTDDEKDKKLLKIYD